MSSCHNKPAKAAKKPNLALCLRLLREVHPYRAGLCLILLLSFLAAPVALLTPVPLKIAVDSGLGNTPLPEVLTAILPSSLADSRLDVILISALLVILVMLLNQAQWMTCYLLGAMVGQRMVIAFRSKLFRHVQRLSFAFHDQRGSADSTYRIQWDAAAIRYVTIDVGIPFLSSTVTLAAMLYVTFKVNWQLGLVALSVSPLMIVIALFFHPRLRRNAREFKERESAAFAVIPETLGALRVVKAFAQEDRERDRFIGQSHASLKAQIRCILTECSMGMLVGLTIATGTAAVLYLGASQVLSGRLTMGELILILGYITQLYPQLRAISNTAATMQSHLASAERALSLLDEPDDVPTKPNAQRIVRARGEVRFESVSFGYPDGPKVLSNVNLDIPPGSRVGIVGRTGSGKTSMVSLLMRFFDVTGGAIYLDGVDLRDYQLADLRRQFSIVLQDPVLFSTTIKENIAYGRPDASEREIVESAKAAHAHDFITKLPDGYETRVGERGMTLSGGERQRISLARAFLANAPILILDEPTSSVDVKTEGLIMDALGRLMEGRTTFMIAHRLSTLNKCDFSVTLSEGKLETNKPTSPLTLVGA